jgi:hypothetical protein
MTLCGIAPLVVWTNSRNGICGSLKDLTIRFGALLVSPQNRKTQVPAGKKRMFVKWKANQTQIDSWTQLTPSNRRKIY